MQHRTHHVAAASRDGLVEQESHAGWNFAHGPAMTATVSPSDVIAFWREAGPDLWFAKDDAFDRRFRELFLEAHESAALGEFDHWQRTPGGTLALIPLLDQFPRNVFRGTRRMYATDAAALSVARAAMTGTSIPICGSCSICRSHIRNRRRTRNALSRCAALLAGKAGPMPKVTATSSSGSAASLTAIRSSDARRAKRNGASSMRAVSGDSEPAHGRRPPAGSKLSMNLLYLRETQGDNTYARDFNSRDNAY